MEDVVYKHPTATQNYTVDFTDLLADADASLTSEAATATDTNGDAITAVIGALTKSGLVLTIPLQAGVDGEDYNIIISATGDSSGLVGVVTLELRVRVEGLGNM